MASPTFAAVLLVCLSGRVLSKIPLLVSLHPIFYSPHIVNSNNTNNRIGKKKKEKEKNNQCLTKQKRCVESCV
jgi:hypothetical protein